MKLVNPIAKWLKKNAPEQGGAPVAEALISAGNTGMAPVYTPIVPDLHAEEEQAIDLSEPLFNVNKLLDMSGKNNDFVVKMLQLFVNETPQSVMKIKDAYKSRDMETVKYYAHMMKPSIFNLGIHPVKDEIVQIETMAENGETGPVIASKIEKLEKIIRLVIEQMRSQYSL